jgi:hypothetical protein
MRYLPFLLFSLLLTACAGEPTPDTAAEAAADTQLTTPAGRDLPADQKMTGDPATDTVITRYAYLENQYQTGMLQRKDAVYECGKINGRIELYNDKGDFAMAINSYNDGPQRSVTDRWYFTNGKPAHLFSESVTWEIAGPSVIDSNGNELPGIRTATAHYRYYLADGKTFKFLKKKWEHFNYRNDNVDPASVADEPAATDGAVPERIALVTTARETGVVDCAAFQ